MDQLSQKLADRYALVLGEGWQNWFSLGDDLRLPGAFQQRVEFQELVAETPYSIWPGFMLPDSLPIVGNGYGDWLCIRIDEQGRIGELLHWYHGGGDWIPVGDTIEQAILHDLVDQFRPLQRQMLRGAGETLDANHLEQVRTEIADPRFQAWLRTGLNASNSQLESLFSGLAAGHYRETLLLMREQGWAMPATTCDLIESELQAAVTRELVANAGELFGANARAIARCLFDPEQSIAPENPVRSETGWHLADWNAIRGWCAEIAANRHDLAWANDLLGWCYQRHGDFSAATAAYFAGRHAPAFTNQAVRLRTHWFNQRFGKFSIAQLKYELPQGADESIVADPYLSLYPGDSTELLQRVTAYWETLAVDHMSAGRYADAYDCWMQAGWDLGAPAIADYRRILSGLVDAANRAGWTARARVAETHLNCLAKRK